MNEKKSINHYADLLSLVTGKEIPDIKTLAARINDLIENDFHQLISVLYRMDVSETKLRTLLKENPEQDAANMIAALIIERQMQKIASRKEHRSDNNIPDEEKW